MKRSFLLFCLLCSFIHQASALISISVSGNTNTVPALAPSYISLSSAISALNSVSTINGPVTFLLNAGTTETTSTQLIITQSGSIQFPITFQKNGAGINPKLTRTDAGTIATAGRGAYGDAVLRIDGTDNIHFNGLDLAATNQGIEYGYYIHKPNATNGSKQLSVRMAAITMTKGNSAYGIGIYVDNGQTSLTNSDGLTISTANGCHTDITIAGNTIQNTHRGIFFYGNTGIGSTFYDANFSIGEPGNGNTILNIGGGNTTETTGIYSNYIVNISIHSNTIQNVGGGGSAHAGILYGINVYGSKGLCSINNNSITINSTSGEADWIRVYSFGYSNSIPDNQMQLNNNTFAGTVASTSYLIYIAVTADGTQFETRNNSTSGTITQSSTGALNGYYQLTNENQKQWICGNNFSNLTSGGSCVGIYSSNGLHDTTYIDSNIVSNLSTSSATASCTGIEIRNSPKGYVRDNSIFNLHGSGAKAITIIATTNEEDVEVLRNKIYSLNGTSTSTTDNIVAGIFSNNSGESGRVQIYNNLIGLLSAPSSGALNAIQGISLQCSSPNDTFHCDVSHNTIYIHASSSTATNFGTSGIFQFVSTTAPTLEQCALRNNIVVNLSNPKGTGASVAFRRGLTGTSTNSLSPLSNRNVYYAGTPSASRVIFQNGTTKYTQLSDYQSFLLSAVPAAERNSMTENPTFQSIVGSSPNFLKYDTSIASVIESNGQVIVDIRDDVMHQPRAGQLSYTGTGISPDIGAWELNGIAVSPCAGVPPTPTALISQVNPCTDSMFAVYIDPVYGNGFTYQWQTSSVDSLSSFTDIPNATESYFNTGAIINRWYRCIVTCVYGNQSVVSNAVAVTITPLSGTYVISNTGSGNYLSFAAAIADLHCRSANGAVVFEVVDGQIFTETTNLSIRYNGIHPITFKKQLNGANPIIRRVGTSSTSNYILELLGADNITFDGINFEQTGTASSSWVEYGIHITNNGSGNGAQYNTFKNGSITLTNANVNTIGVHCRSVNPKPASISGTNSYNRFVNMTVQQAYQGYRFDAVGNIVKDQGNEVVGENGLRGNINSLGNGTLSASIYGIYAVDQGNFKVDSVDIYGIQSTSFSYAIYSNGSDSSVQIFSNNHIQFHTSSSSMRGLALENLSVVHVFNNDIHEINSSSTTGGNIIGLSVSCKDSSMVYNNKIYNLSASNASTGYVYGLALSDSGNHLVYNNMISDVRCGGSSTYPAASAGIKMESLLGGHVRLYHNSVWLYDVSTNASNRSAGLYVRDSTVSLDMRNNVIVNASNVNTGSIAAAFVNYHHLDNILPTCNHNLWYAGVPDAKHLIYWAIQPAFTATTLSQYKALSIVYPAEGESVSALPDFIPSLTGDVRPNPLTPGLIEGRGQAIAEVGFDFDNEVRNTLTPDLGADEGIFSPSLSADCVALNWPANLLTDICPFEIVTLTWTEPISGRTPTGGYDIYFGTSPNPPLHTNTTNLSYTTPSLGADSTYYWKIIAKYANEDAVGCETRSFSTSNTGITSVVNATRCGPGILNLSVNGGGTIQWYSTAIATTPFTTGSDYTTTLSNTTNYYVSSVNGYQVQPQNVGKINLGTSSSTSSSSTEHLLFNVLRALVMDSVVVYPSSAGNVVLQLTNSAGTVLQTATKAVTLAQIGQAVAVFVNWPIAAGNGYRIYKPASSVNLLRNTTGAAYPYTIPSLITITGSSAGASFYSWAYNWTLRGACESPRQLITATITNNSASSSTINTCNAYTWSINGATYTSSGVYVHTTIPASGCIHTDSLILTVGVSGNNPPQTVTACGSYTWPLNGNSYTSSGIYTATFTNVNGCDSSWQLNLTINTCISNVQVKVFVEGYYAGNGLMQPVLMNQGIGSDPNITDFVTLEFRNPVDYSLAAVTNAIVQTNGNVSASLALAPGAYYIIVKHRHSIETWSAIPVNIGAVAVMYDFTQSASMAYGNNQVEVEPGIWACYAGDINGDGNIDIVDLAGYELDVANILFGYFASDLNGDGNVDLLDGPILETNLSNYIYKIVP